MAYAMHDIRQRQTDFSRLGGRSCNETSGPSGSGGFVRSGGPRRSRFGKAGPQSVATREPATTTLGTSLPAAARKGAVTATRSGTLGRVGRKARRAHYRRPRSRYFFERQLRDWRRGRVRINTPVQPQHLREGGCRVGNPACRSNLFPGARRTAHAGWHGRQQTAVASCPFTEYELGVLAAMGMLRIKNWTEYQHYKDRCPSWIKLHTKVLDDPEIRSLPDAMKGQLFSIWLLASRLSTDPSVDAAVPDDPPYLSALTGAKISRHSLDTLIDFGFLVPVTEPQVGEDRWKSRYVSDALRDEVMKRDGSMCVRCESVDGLEIDHVVPVSAPHLIDELLDGDPACIENLQVLCRVCNRAKRSVKGHGLAVWVLHRNGEGLRSKLLRSTPTSVEPSRDAHAHSVSVSYKGSKKNQKDKGFAEFWRHYPKRVGKLDAQKAWKQTAKKRPPIDELIAKVDELSVSRGWLKDNGQWIPHPATWLRAGGWDDEVRAKR